jgi:hypothetical protein
MEKSTFRVSRPEGVFGLGIFNLPDGMLIEGNRFVSLFISHGFTERMILTPVGFKCLSVMNQITSAIMTMTTIVAIRLVHRLTCQASGLT